MLNFALKFLAVAEKTTKDARGLLYFAAPGIYTYRTKEPGFIGNSLIFKV